MLAHLKSTLYESLGWLSLSTSGTSSSTTIWAEETRLGSERGGNAINISIGLNTEPWDSQSHPSQPSPAIFIVTQVVANIIMSLQVLWWRWSSPQSSLIRWSIRGWVPSPADRAGDRSQRSQHRPSSHSAQNFIVVDVCAKPFAHSAKFCGNDD